MTFNLCQYKNIFGAPGTGIHKYRILDVAIVDVVATLLLAALITWIWYKNTSKKNKKHVGWVLLGVTIGLFILGVGAHRLFCVDTTVDKKLFGKQTACAPCTPCKYQYPIRS